MKGIKPLGSALHSGPRITAKRPDKPYGGDAQGMARRFFLYQNVFGDKGGAPRELGKMGQMRPVKGGIAAGQSGGQNLKYGLTGIGSPHRLGLL